MTSRRGIRDRWTRASRPRDAADARATVARASRSGASTTLDPWSPPRVLADRIVGARELVQDRAARPGRRRRPAAPRSRVSNAARGGDDPEPRHDRTALGDGAA